MVPDEVMFKIDHAVNGNGRALRERLTLGARIRIL